MAEMEESFSNALSHDPNYAYDEGGESGEGMEVETDVDDEVGRSSRYFTDRFALVRRIRSRDKKLHGSQTS